MNRREQFQKETSIPVPDLRGMPSIQAYVQHLERRADLLRELAIRTKLCFPANPKELKWFKEGTREAYDFHKRLDNAFEKEKPQR